MTLEEFKKVLDRINFHSKSSSFPGCGLGLQTKSCGLSGFESAKEFIRENGNPCRIISADKNRQSCDCICFSVGEWLYFVERDDRVCLRRASWDKVVFLDTDLIRIR